MIHSVSEALQAHIVRTNQEQVLACSNFTNVTKNDVVEVLSALGSIQIQNRIRQNQSATRFKQASDTPDISQYIKEWNEKPKTQTPLLLANKGETDYHILVEAFKQCHPPRQIKDTSKQVIITQQARTKENSKQKYSQSSSSSVSYRHRTKNNRRNSKDYDRDLRESIEKDRESSRYYVGDKSRSREWEREKSETGRERERQRERRSREKQKRYYVQDRQHKQEQRYGEREKMQSRQSYRQKDRSDRYRESREPQYRDERYNVSYQNRYRKVDWQYANYRSGHQYSHVPNQRELDNKQGLYLYYQQSAQTRDYYKRYA